MVGEFITGKIYVLRTTVINTSVLSLDVQLLIDLPQGSLPIRSHEYTRITSERLEAFSVKSHQNSFYFPSAGTFKVYPANVSKTDKIIAKADRLEQIVVKQKYSERKLETFDDVLRSGDKNEVLKYLNEKNLFTEKEFTASKVLWMLGDDEKFYSDVIDILRKRNYFDE